MERIHENSQNALALSDVFSAFEKFQAIIENLYSTLSAEEIEKKSARLISEHLNLHTYLLMVYDMTSGKFFFACSNGLSKEATEVLVENIISNKANLLKPEEISLEIKIEDKLFKLITLKQKKKFFGVIAVPKPVGEALSIEEIEFLKVLSLSIIYAYTNAKLYELTRKMAIWDNKTNLYNYRYFLARLSNEINRAKRYGRKLSLVAFDIDGFKEVNQKFGHLVADKILRDIGKLIRDSIRAVDIPSRFGGDEFFILLPETDISGARIVASRIQNLVETNLFPLGSKSNRVKIGITFGLAEFCEKMTARDLMKKADDDLLRKKSR